MDRVQQSNGTAPAKRGRGRPRKPRAKLEDFDAEMFRAAMAEADQIEERTRTLQQLVAEQATAGMHPGAFRLCRKLSKQGPAEARAFHAALTRYLVAAALI